MLQRKVIFLVGFILAISQAWAADKVELKTDNDKLSYSIGVSVGKNFKLDGTEVNLDLMIKGFKAAIAGDKTALTEKEIQQIMGTYQMELRKHAMARNQLAIQENKKKGDAFLAENKAKNGVVTTDNGLQYKIIKSGSGKKPLESDMVEVNYRGSLIDGKEFDATQEGKPATLKVSSLISGWKQALTMMPVGSKWQLVVPSQLAYGERGVGNDIGPNQVLVFEVELVGIK
jgi:FKBP-type peptidyl-prolyl cis-trans isomerase FklB